MWCKALPDSGDPLNLAGTLLGVTLRTRGAGRGCVWAISPSKSTGGVSVRVCGTHFCSPYVCLPRRMCASSSATWCMWWGWPWMSAMRMCCSPPSTLVSLERSSRRAARCCLRRVGTGAAGGPCVALLKDVARGCVGGADLGEQGGAVWRNECQEQAHRQRIHNVSSK